MNEKLLESIEKNLKAVRQDIENPHKKQDDIEIYLPDDDEDENTLAKSIIDEIIEETETEDDGGRPIKMEKKPSELALS